MIDPDAKVARTRELFMQGYNCAQAVAAAFAPEMGLCDALALRMSGALGGGLGGLREVCGAVSAMAFVLGALTGYDVPDQAAKQRLYARIQAQSNAFRAENGTLICRELLQAHGIEAGPVPAVRDAAYYQKRPCLRYVEQCARATAEALNAAQAEAPTV